MNELKSEKPALSLSLSLPPRSQLLKMELEDDEWELCYDDGFVYKRKRRRLNPPPPPPPEADREAAEKLRKERKKQTLLKLKAKYEKEIVQWENLSNTLRSMQLSVPRLPQQQQLQQPDQTLSLPSTSSSAGSALLSDLLSQVTSLPLRRFQSILLGISNKLKFFGAITNWVYHLRSLATPPSIPSSFFRNIQEIEKIWDYYKVGPTFAL